MFIVIFQTFFSFLVELAVAQVAEGPVGQVFKYDFVMNIRSLHQLIGECACHKNYKPGNVAHLYDLGDVDSANICFHQAKADLSIDNRRVIKK